MTDAIGYFGAEFKIFLFYFIVPFANNLRAIYLIVGSVEFNGVIVFNEMFEEVCVFGSFGINFSDPFFSTPFCSTQVNQRLFSLLKRVYYWQVL